YEFGMALTSVEEFFWKDVCDNYFEMIKHQLFNPQEYEPSSVHATRWTLYRIGLRILQLYAPYIPHITETIYEQIYQSKEQVASLHQTQFEQYQQSSVFQDSAASIK